MRRSRRAAYSARTTYRRAIVYDGRASESRLKDREAGELEHLPAQLRIRSLGSER